MLTDRCCVEDILYISTFLFTCFIYYYRKIRAETFTLPKSVTGLKCVDTLKILDCHLLVQKHVDNLVQISGKNLYTLKTLKFH